MAHPTGEPLPNLYAMGARSAVASVPHPDLFLEINAMRTEVAKNHGSSSAPYAPYNGAGTTPATVSVPAHTHMPSPQVLKLIGDAYFDHGITPHFDVGNIDDYHDLGVVAHTDWVDDYMSPEVDTYLVPTLWARGGEVLDERPCDATLASCQFPAFPGVVGWKFGFQQIRNWAVGDLGQELLTSAQLQDWFNGAGASLEHRQRFDVNRRGLFRYLLFGHYRGKPKADLHAWIRRPLRQRPSRTTAAPPVRRPIRTMSTTTAVEPSGVADLPGSNLLVTLGRWNEFLGRPFVQASTAFHELGHNLNLTHGGLRSVGQQIPEHADEHDHRAQL